MNDRTTWSRLRWLIATLCAGVLLSACGGGSGGGASSNSSSGGGSSSSSGGAAALCPNLPQASSVIGQSGFTSGSANSSGVSGSGYGGVEAATATNGALFYTADTTNNRILGYNTVPAGAGRAADFVIGQPDTVSSAQGTGAQGANPIGLGAPAKVWVDAVSGTLAVADSGNNRVLIWHPLPTGNVAPTVVLGQADQNSGAANQGAGPSSSSLSDPTGVVVAGGKVAVADLGNSRVLIWNSVPTANGQAADLVLGQSDFNSGTAGTIDQFNNATQTYNLRMNQPFDIWSDGNHLLVTDTGNNRVLYWGSFPTTQNQLASNLLGVDKFGDVAPPNGSGGTSGFRAPHGVASDGNDVFVADTGNNRVMLFTNYLATPSNDKSATGLFGQSQFFDLTANDPDQNGQSGDQSVTPNTSGITAGTFSAPQGLLAPASGGGIYVTDSGNSRVLAFPVSAAVDGSNPQVPCSN